MEGRLRQRRRELLSPPQTLLPPWLVRDLEGGSRSLREPLKGKIEPFFSEGTWLWAGLRLQQLGRRQPRNSHFKLPPPLGPWSPGALLSWAPESGEDREKEGEAAGPGGVPKPKQWPKIITRRRIPAQKKKEDKLCVARGSRRYLESAGGGRPSDYSLRGAPHPRAAERIFPWGGLLASRRRACLPLSSWGIPPARTRNPRRPLSPFPRGPFLPSCPRENSLLRPPGAPIESRLGPARGGQLSLGEVRGLQALQLLLRLPSSKAWGRGCARGAPEEAG